MCFTIRDLFWLVMVVSLTLTVLQQAARVSEGKRRTDLVVRHAEALRVELQRAEQNEQAYLGKLAEVTGIDDGGLGGEVVEVDWTLTDHLWIP